MRKMFLVILFVLCALLIGCTKKDTTDWTQSPTFTYENITMYGTEGKIGIVRVNGKPDEPGVLDFPATQGRLYEIYFFEQLNDMLGKDFKMEASLQDSDETVQLVKSVFWGSKTRAKFGFGQEGLWKITVTIDDKPYTSFIIQAEEI